METHYDFPDRFFIVSSIQTVLRDRIGALGTFLPNEHLIRREM